MRITSENRLYVGLALQEAPGGYAAAFSLHTSTAQTAISLTPRISAVGAKALHAPAPLLTAAKGAIRFSLCPVARAHRSDVSGEAPAAIEAST
ncbi:hypothetical protein MRX96_002592 [Rhipicephalus microplus]